MHDSCVCMMSVCEIYQRIIIKLTVQAFAILGLFFILFLFSLCVMPLRFLVGMGVGDLIFTSNLH